VLGSAQSAVRTKNQLVAAKDKQLNDLQNELEQVKVKLRDYQKDNEVYATASSAAECVGGYAF
jgi:hypothetical protein